MHSESSPADGEIEVKLDNLPVALPSERRSLTAIRSLLDSLALQRQRILYSFSVDGEPVDLAQPVRTPKSFSRVEATTIGLEDVPAQLIETALCQTASLLMQVQSAVTLVLINDAQRAREFWWSLTKGLKEPLLTLSLLPRDFCGATFEGASLLQLRKWQLEQLGYIISDVDEACRTRGPIALSTALEDRVLPWLEKLDELLHLCHQSVLADPPAVPHLA